MIPTGDSSVPALPGEYIHPWVPGDLTSLQWGPVQLQDGSQGLLNILWTLEVEGATIYVSSSTHTRSVVLTHPLDIIDASLAFDQNGNLVVSFSDTNSDSYLHWWDPLIPAYDTMQLPVGVFTPRVTLDDARRFNVAQSDVILMYARAGGLKYRISRERYTVEYDAIDGTTGQPIPADIVYHVSMLSTMRLGVAYRTGPTLVFETPQIMKKQIVLQKSPVEALPITFDFNHVLGFGDPIATAAVNIIVQSGTDPSPSDMLDGGPTYNDYSVTQVFKAGVVGNIYKISMSARTAGNSVYVVEGALYVNNSPAPTPPVLP